MLLQLKDSEATEILKILRSELARRRNFISISEDYNMACSMLGEVPSPEVDLLIKRYSTSIAELEDIIHIVEAVNCGIANGLPF